MKSMGWAGQVKYYYDFIMQTDFLNMNPAQALVNTPNLLLANAGNEYVIYAPSGGAVTLNLTGTTGAFSVKWFNPRTGVYTSLTNTTSGGSRTFTSPDSNDWILYLKKITGTSLQAPTNVKVSSFIRLGGIYF
jgi:hypothetical protein